MPWKEFQGGFSVWSGETLGASPGPAQWTFQQDADGFHVSLLDPLESVPLKVPHFSEVEALRVEVLSVDVGGQEGEAHWNSISQWDVSRSFHPAGVRLWIRWKHQEAEECIVRML